PPRPDPLSGRYRARACADVLIAVTVRACPTEDALVSVATGLLYGDLSLLRQFVDIIDAPTVYDTATSRDTRPAGTTFDSDPNDSDPYDGDRDDGGGHEVPEGDGNGAGSWDRFLDPFDDDGPADDRDVDWAYPDDTDVDDES